MAHGVVDSINHTEPVLNAM